MKIASLLKTISFLLTAVAHDAYGANSNGSVKPTTDHQTLFSQQWNKTFHLRETENGEMLSIGAVFMDAATIFIYDQAQGAVVALDTLGKVLSTIPLASIGRTTYAGDDFIVVDSVFIFLNGVDRRLEYFNRFTGKHVRAVPIPADLLADAPRRSQRIVNRLFFDNGQLMIGNEYRLVAFDCKLGKRMAAAAVVSVAANERLVLYTKKHPLIMRDSLIVRQAPGTACRLPSTHYPIVGKRFFTIGERLFSVDAGKDSVRIAEVR